MAEIDRHLRGRLTASFDYLRESRAAGADLQWDRLDSLEDRLSSGPVSPWVFGLYSKFVADLSKGRDSFVLQDFDDLLTAANRPAAEGVVALDDARVPPAWWEHFRVLLDTDPQRPFRPDTPAGGEYEQCAREIAGALAILEAGDPEFHRETGLLLRMIAIGAPGAGDGFNGASTFFMRGAALLNGRPRRSPISMIDVLVHEASHLLLFGLAADEPLTRNTGQDRHASPLRADVRPVDGIFHAAYVTARVHLAMDRLMQSGALGAEDRSQALARMDENARAARTAMEVVGRSAVLTDTGRGILDVLRTYWAAIPAA